MKQRRGSSGYSPWNLSDVCLERMLAEYRCQSATLQHLRRNDARDERWKDGSGVDEGWWTSSRSFQTFYERSLILPRRSAIVSDPTPPPANTEHETLIAARDLPARRFREASRALRCTRREELRGTMQYARGTSAKNKQTAEASLHQKRNISARRSAVDARTNNFRVSASLGDSSISILPSHVFHPV